MLLHKGKVSLNPTADGFSESSLKVVASRSGVGLTKSGKFIMAVCTDPVTLEQFAGVIQSLGVVEAMNLDGGPASGLYHDGRTIVDARLQMTNLLVVYKKKR